MFQSKYIPGQTIPHYDVAVTAAIDSYGIDGGGSALRIAVENLDGAIYRVITSVGLGAYMYITSKLWDLGLRDPLKNDIHGKDGYDSWFVPTPELVAAAAPESTTDAASEILAATESLSSLDETERQAVIRSRVGQGEFRAKLLGYWKCCAVTGAECLPLLRASHIKPWRDADNRERLDVFNGLLLAPNIDAAFDAGYVTFDAQGKIMFSKAVTGGPAYQLHLSAKMRINQKLLKPEHLVYLEHHRNSVFLG